LIKGVFSTQRTINQVIYIKVWLFNRLFCCRPPS